jgi:hypothetical protein
VEQRKQARGRHQRFIGSWARLNCESMPVVPAWLLRRNLDDPRGIPYLLVWRDLRHGGKIKEAVRLAHFIACGQERNHYVELKRNDESTTVLRIVWRTLPRNGGRALLLLCPYCDTPRRFVYGWEWDSFSRLSNRVRQVPWCCRSCDRLRYSSEGGYLRQGVRAERLFAGMGFPGKLPPLPRPESWLPYVFTSIDDPRLDEIVPHNRP